MLSYNHREAIKPLEHKKGNHMTRYRWAIYFTWNDGFKDTFNCETAKERDMNIKDMIKRGEFKEIEYCRIAADGEYLENVKAL